MEEYIQKTLVVIKPDGVQRMLVGEIIQRFERVGLKLSAIKMLRVDAVTVERHYLVNPDWKKEVGEKMLQNTRRGGEGKTAEEAGEEVLRMLQKFMTAGPVVALVLEGAHAVSLTRKLVGGTEPLSSDVGTIRGDFVLDSYVMADGAGRAIRNIIHASSSVEDVNAEIGVWFKPEEILDYTTAHEKILYDINFDNVAE